MKVLIINAILYTAETSDIPKVSTIKDTMIYDLCLAFMNAGHDVTLYAADKYKPVVDEEYPFNIEWGKCKLTRVFLPSRLPWMPGIKRFLKKNHFDMIISSEVFSTSTYYAYRICKDKVIAWHEIAKHQAMLHQIPSKIWYKLITKFMMRDLHVVARSVEARGFIKQYCSNVEETVVDHGVNLGKFEIERSKKEQFIVCSQLIPRKRVDGIIDFFRAFLEKGYSNYTLYIVGTGECEDSLRKQVKHLEMDSRVFFTGKLSHKDLMPILKKSKALLVNTVKDNSMISIVESIAVGTPVVTTEVPLNASYIKQFELGIAKEWDENDLEVIVLDNKKYMNNCLKYRDELSTKARVNQFIEIMKDNTVS